MIWLALVGGACDPRPLPLPEDFPDVQTCGAAWETVHPLGIMSGGSRAMSWAGGTLYVSVREPTPRVLALSADGAARTIVETEADRIWIEGDRLLYAKRNSFFQVPLAGGRGSLIVDWQAVQNPWTPGVTTNVEVDPTHYYWDWKSKDGYEVWRAARGGAAAEVVLRVPPSDPPYAWPLMNVLSDQVVVGFDAAGTAHAVPKSGGAARALSPAPFGASLLGVGPRQALWGVGLPDVHRKGLSLSRTEVRASRVGTAASAGEAEPFWTDKPPGVKALGLGAWPVDGDGWIVTAIELFSDLAHHLTLWLVGTDGFGTRLACNPVAGTGLATAMTTSPDAFLLVVGVSNTQSSYLDYSVVRIGR